jgi:host factor-I protein
VEPTNYRKPLRSSIAPPKENMPTSRLPASAAKKPVPPEQTNAENFYYMKQMQTKTPMVIVLTDGEVIQGVIEWYDKMCLKVNREGAPNLLLYKANIKYMYKVGE